MPLKRLEIFVNASFTHKNLEQFRMWTHLHIKCQLYTLSSRPKLLCTNVIYISVSFVEHKIVQLLQKRKRQGNTLKCSLYALYFDFCHKKLYAITFYQNTNTMKGDKENT